MTTDYSWELTEQAHRIASGRHLCASGLRDAAADLAKIRAQMAGEAAVNNAWPLMVEQLVGHIDDTCARIDRQFGELVDSVEQAAEEVRVRAP